MAERTLEIPNKKGLHARAAAKFVQMAETYSAEIEVIKDDMAVGGTSIMGLLMLAASANTSITVRARGVDAQKAVDALSGLVLRGFDEG